MKRWVILAVLLALVMLVSGCKTNEAQPTSPESVTEQDISPQQGSDEQLSEQPDSGVFSEYFTEFYLSKLPVGQKINPPNFPVKSNIFTSADQFCASWTQLKVIPFGKFATAVYDKNTKDYLSQKLAFPKELNRGGNAGCENLKFPVGGYEYKVYVNDVLVAVLPFVVR